MAARLTFGVWAASLVRWPVARRCFQPVRRPRHADQFLVSSGHRRTASCCFGNVCLCGVRFATISGELSLRKASPGTCKTVWELLSSILSCHPDHRPSAAMVRSHHFRFGWDVAHCQDRLDEDGYVVVKGIFPEPMISAAVAAIRDRVLLLLRLYDLMPANAVGVFEALLSAIPLLHRAPPGWPGLPFGACGKKGWVKPVGSGRMFDDFIQRPQYHEHPGRAAPLSQPQAEETLHRSSWFRSDVQ